MRVLVADDDTALAETLRRGLVHHGHVVEVAHNGEDALWAATEFAFDAVVLDIMLPKLNGCDVLRQARARQVWTPVLMLTAIDDVDQQADALDAGADDYLTKPFSFVVLLARLRALARRGAPERPTVLSAGDLRLDPAAHRVSRGDTEVKLTPREFGLLEFLLRHVGDVVSKSEILDGVWDSAFDGDDNVVEVYTRYLRNKIDIPFGRAAIETVRGKGYRLDHAGG